MNLDLLRELIRIFEESDLNEIEIEEDGQRMRLHKAPPVVANIVAPTLLPPEHAAPTAADGPESTEAEADDLSGFSMIDSPMVGTYYSASAPGEPSFVQVGDRVDENATICIVEAMKLMNEITTKFDCVIEKILVENGEPVEFGQSLFAVSPL